MPILQFKGKTAVETYHHSLPHHTFEFDAKLSELGKGEKPSLDGNLIIEGDNLLALKALLPTHAGRIKCIYIDPPYNTGEEGWIYNDNLTQPQFKEWIGQVVGKEEEDACRHDKWCCMIYPRLAILRDLLTDDGILFASIGEDEFHNLRLVANELFRVEKPLITFVWRRRSPSGMRKDPVSSDHEYVTGYARNPVVVSLSGLVVTEDQYPFVEKDGRRYASTDLSIGATSEDRPHQFYPIRNPRTGVEYAPNPNRVWRFEPDEMLKVINKDLIIWPDEVRGELKRPRYKTHFDPDVRKTKAVSSWITGLGSVPNSESEDYDEDIAEINSGFTAEGGRILRRIFGRKVLNYPKPVSLVRSLLKVATARNDLCLDSFAGSGTTAHAVLGLNKEDGGGRKFILIQQPFDTKQNKAEKFNICQKITSERVQRVINGYSYKTQSGKTEKVAGTGGSFTYARLSAKPLFGEYRDFGENPPPYEEIAKYVFYTETSRQWNPKGLDKTIGRIGEHNDTSYYLLYSPNQRSDWAIDAEFLKAAAAKDPNNRLVVYAEKIWLHRSALREWEAASGKAVRTMIVPFNLR